MHLTAYLSGPAAILRIARALMLTYFRRPKSMRCMPAAKNWSASQSCSIIVAVPCMCMSLKRMLSMFSCSPDRMRGSSAKSCSVLSNRSCLDVLRLSLLCRGEHTNVVLLLARLCNAVTCNAESCFSVECNAESCCAAKCSTVSHAVYGCTQAGLYASALELSSRGQALFVWLAS